MTGEAHPARAWRRRRRPGSQYGVPWARGLRLLDRSPVGHGAAPAARRSGPRPLAARLLLLALAPLVAAGGLACAGDFVRREGPDGPRLESRKRGYTIALPPSPPPNVWRSTEVPGTDLAYENQDGAAMSLTARCRKTRAPVAALARQLTIGTSRDVLLAAGPIEHRGDPGWSQTFDTREQGVELRVKAVTLVCGRCIYDWLLVARAPVQFLRAEPDFDFWMRSFAGPQARDADAGPVSAPSSLEAGAAPEAAPDGAAIPPDAAAISAAEDGP